MGRTLTKLMNMLPNISEYLAQQSALITMKDRKVVKRCVKLRISAVTSKK